MRLEARIGARRRCKSTLQAVCSCRRPGEARAASPPLSRRPGVRSQGSRGACLRNGFADSAGRARASNGRASRESRLLRRTWLDCRSQGRAAGARRGKAAALILIAHSGLVILSASSPDQPLTCHSTDFTANQPPALVHCHCTATLFARHLRRPCQAHPSYRLSTL